MTNVTIFGTGNMGSAIASVLAAGCASVEHIRPDGTVTVSGDVVVLAVPYEALADITVRYADQLAGKDRRRVLEGFNTTLAAALAIKQIGDPPSSLAATQQRRRPSQTHRGGRSTGHWRRLARAHELEALGFLQLTLAAAEEIGWTGGFGILK